MPKDVPRWHALTSEVVATNHASSLETGLGNAEAARRLEVQGPNTLPEGHRRGPARILLAQFADFMVIVLVAAAVLAGFVGEPEDTSRSSQSWFLTQSWASFRSTARSVPSPRSGA